MLLRHIKAGSCIKQSSRNGFCHFSPLLIHYLILLNASRVFLTMATVIFLFCQVFQCSLSPLFTVDFILQLVFCHSYLISSSVPNKEFNLFSLSQRLRRELITVYRHFNSLTVHSDSILTLQRYTGPSTSKYTLEKLKLE